MTDGMKDSSGIKPPMLDWPERMKTLIGLPPGVSSALETADIPRHIVARKVDTLSALLFFINFLVCLLKPPDSTAEESLPLIDR